MHKSYLFIVSLLMLVLSINAQEHPTLIMTKQTTPELQAALDIYPAWKENVEAIQTIVDAAMQNEIDVPVPVDPAGGYTHGQHKENAKLLNKLGALYQVTSDEKYAAYAKDLFLAYADVYLSFEEHPVKKSYAPGKLFWQQLNEAVWLIDAIQGYDGIYDYLSEEERKTIEKELLLPFADFLSIENKKVFNRIHNHGVWAVAAVGMTGITLNNNELVCRALYGINDKNKPNSTTIDTINLAQYQSGFFTQTTSLFSPDGYYTEGPYYQRYAMTPFLLFAQSLENNYSQLNILAFHDSIYINAVQTLTELTDADGNFLPINDYIKGMSLKAPEMVFAIDFLYAHTHNIEVLNFAIHSRFRLINSLGLEVVKGLNDRSLSPLKQESKLITDGSKGNSGGIVLLRDWGSEFCSVFKFASQGLTHGHFDRLNLFHYHKANEVITDYGAARFVNVKAKEGGRYLPENFSYAKHTVAHNTLVINEKSHFDYNFKEASKHNPEYLFSDFENQEFQIACASESNAYQGVKMVRTIAMLDNEAFINPIVIDLFMVQNDKSAKTYDLPFHYKGQLMSTSFEYEANTSSLKPLGDDNGYQHLWLTAQGKSNANNASITFLDHHYIYSLTSVVDTSSTLLLTEIGANDPNFNLRNEPAFIIRNNNVGNHTYANVLECHGHQNPATERVINQTKQVQQITVLATPKNYVACSITTVNNQEFIVLVCIDNNNDNTSHSIKVNDNTYEWEGSYTLIKNN